MPSSLFVWIAYCYDLGIDPDELRSLDDEALAKRLQTSPRPIRKVRKNAAPSFCPLGEAPPEMLGDIPANVGWHGKHRPD
jgi:exodeoxyribonuclease-1